ncbi:MAG: phenylalanyl-tRNA synthetase beta chain [Actinomycetota bacterium]
MKVLLSWLNEFADFGNDVELLAAEMTSLGMPVEETFTVGSKVPGVVVAQVLRTERHPDAEKVHRVYLTTDGNNELHVWCGAFNMSAGDKIPLATLGTKMPDGREILRRGILGIDSEGMCCSASELGINDDHGGIHILPADLPLGVDVFDALGITTDTVFDLDLTRNRPDCWGHLGVARDLAARMRLPFGSDVPGAASHSSHVLPLAIVDDASCGRFTVTVVKNIRVMQSPQWLQDRLSRSGMRPINNIVDASNYVMLERNQPTHAYDLRAVESGFRVRFAKSGESLTTLDGQARELHGGDVVIANGDDLAVGLGGVMGGLDSEVVESTTAIALEAAWFPADTVLESAARHGLRSEASARFERGADPHGLEQAAWRFIEILSLTCPDLEVHGAPQIVVNDMCPAPKTTVDVRLGQVQRILGVEVSARQVAELIEPIGFACTLSDGIVKVAIPSWRPDSTSEIDVIEEIARHYGYDALGKSVPNSTVHGRLSPLQQRRRLVHSVMVEAGWCEAMPNPFLDPAATALAGVPDEAQLALVNPLVAEESVLRVSLRPGMLRAVAYNQSHRVDDIHLYEVGHVYPKGQSALPDEEEVLCVMSVDAHDGELAALRAWSLLSDALSFGAQIDAKSTPPGYHPGRSATLRRGKQVIGAMGELSPLVLRKYGVSGRVSCVEVSLSTVLREEPKPVAAKPVSRYPSSDIDLAFVASDDLAAFDLHRALKSAAGNLAVSLELFDVYRGKGVESGSRSLAYRLRLQAADRTLTDDEVSAVRQKCIDAAAKVGAVLR